MAQTEFAPAIPAIKRPYVHVLDSAAAEIGYPVLQRYYYYYYYYYF